MPKFDEQWLKEFFEQSVMSLTNSDILDKKLEELENNFGRILIPDTLVNSPKFHLINEMFSFELNHGKDQLIIGLVRDPTSPNLYFEFYVFVALLDYFDEEEFSQKIKLAGEELLRKIIEEEMPLFFEKESESHDILIKTNHFDAFFRDKFTLFEKMLVAAYLNYKHFLTRHPSENILCPLYLQKLIPKWKKGDVVNLGKITQDAYDYIEEMGNKESTINKPPSLTKKLLFWTDPDFIHAMTDALEKHGLRYLEKLSDKGSTAILYKALDPIAGEIRAIKVYMRVGEDIERDFRDIRDQLKRIKNPFIVKILSDGHFNFNDEEIYYFVEEFIDGKSLDAIPEEILLSKDYSDRIKLVYMLVSALDAIHNAYEAHNDLHEGNILIVNDPLTLKIIDPRSSLHSPALGSPDFKDFFTLLSRFFTTEEKKNLGITFIGQEAAAFIKFKGKLETFEEITEFSRMNEEGQSDIKYYSIPRFQVNLCSITTENLIRYLRNAMDNAAQLNFRNWPPIFCDHKIILQPHCIKDNDKVKLGNNLIGVKSVGKDWCLIGFKVGNISDKIAKNVEFRAIIPAKIFVLTWDDVFYTIEDKQNDKQSIYKYYRDDERGTILECSMGDITNRKEVI